MKWLFKFFLWRVTIKTERLNEEERIAYFANELIKSLQRNDKKLCMPIVSNGYGSVDIKIHNFGTDKASLHIQNILNDWEVVCKPTFKTLD